MMERKRFSRKLRDVGAVLRFLSAIKAGMSQVRAPLYSHLSYDVSAGRISDRRQAGYSLIFEGINALQVRDLPEDGKMVPFVSDFFDFSIYIDAESQLIHSKWYIPTASCGCGRLLSSIRNPSSIAIRSRKMRRVRLAKDCGTIST